MVPQAMLSRSRSFPWCWAWLTKELLCSSKARRPNYWKGTPCSPACGDHRLAPWLTNAIVFVRAVAVMVVGLVDNIACLFKLRTSPASLEMETRAHQRVGAFAAHPHELPHGWHNRCSRKEAKPHSSKGKSRQRAHASPHLRYMRARLSRPLPLSCSSAWLTECRFCSSCPRHPKSLDMHDFITPRSREQS